MRVSSAWQAVFSKALRISLDQRDAFSVGAIVGHVQVDTEIIAETIVSGAGTSLHDLWSSPIELAVVVLQLVYFMTAGFAMLSLGAVIIFLAQTGRLDFFAALGHHAASLHRSGTATADGPGRSSEPWRRRGPDARCRRRGRR